MPSLVFSLLRAQHTMGACVKGRTGDAVCLVNTVGLAIGLKSRTKHQAAHFFASPFMPSCTQARVAAAALSNSGTLLHSPPNCDICFPPLRGIHGPDRDPLPTV